MPRRKRQQEGGFILSSIKKAIGIRKDYPPKVRAWLERHGDKTIQSLTIIRTPIQSAINEALNAVSFGAWNRLRGSYGFDTFFHLGLVAEYMDGGVLKRAVIEKNAVINISNDFRVQDNSEYKPIPMKGPVTFRQLLDRAQKELGDDFFLYDAFKNNCQVFIRELLSGSGLLTTEADKFLFQDIDKLVRQLPGHTGHVARALTDLGAMADVVVSGRGMGGKKQKKFHIHPAHLDSLVRQVAHELL